MNLRQYVAIFRKWAWLIALSAALFAAASYLISRNLQPVYRAETTLLVARVLENPNASAQEVFSAGNLARMYQMVATQQPILQATAETLKLDESWESLYFKITTRNPESQLVVISVTDRDPALAADLANEVANQLILHGPIAQQQQQRLEQEAFVKSELAQLKLQIESSRRLLTTLNTQFTLESDPKKQVDLDVRISALQIKIADAQKSYASLSGLVNAGSNLYVSVLSRARVPTTPASPNIPLNVLIATWLGISLAVAGIFVLAYLDDTLKTPEDVQQKLNLPTLGTIARFPTAQPAETLITLQHPRSPVSEAYRILRTSLRFSGIENPAGALLVTSTSPGEGKSTTAANLAVVLAQSGKRVVLIDTDLRRPRLDKIFGIPNNPGLSNLILGEAANVEEIMYATDLETLRVIPSGPLPPNPAEMLDSPQMNQALKTLRAQTDILILDSPPVLAVADASILSTRCSGVMLVIDAGHTRTDVARRAIETLLQTKTKIYGVVFNKLDTRHTGSSYHYYYNYSQDKSKDNGNGNGKKSAVSSLNSLRDDRA